MQEYILAPRRYFSEIIDAMTAQRYALLAWSVIRHHEVAYHVPCVTARSTSLFFWIPGKALIAQAVCTERVEVVEGWWQDELKQAHEATGGWDDHWSIRFYLQIDEEAAMEFYTQRLRQGRIGWEVDSDIAISCPGSSNLESGTVDVFALQHQTLELNAGDFSSRHFFYNPVDRATPTQMAAALTGVMEPLKPFAGDRFGRLLVTNFPPHYAFPNCEPLWWSRFPVKRLRGMCGHMSGSKLSDRTCNK